MSNLPYMQFYPSDFLMDTQTLSMEESGSWMSLICHIWNSSRDGSIVISNQELMNLWRMDIAKCMALIYLLHKRNIFDMKIIGNSEKNPDEMAYKITSRRIARDKKKLKNNAKRQKRFYQNHNAEPNAIPNANLTPKKSEVRSQKSEVRKDLKTNILEQAPKRPLFLKPSVSEVTAYAKSIGFDLNGSRFCDFYESNGWRVGKNSMKNWQAAVRTWRQNDYGGGKNASNGGASSANDAAYFQRVREVKGLRKASFQGPIGTILSGIRDRQADEEQTGEPNGAGDE